MKKLSDVQWAWIAGVFEGEGSISFMKEHSARVRVNMNDEDVIRKLHEVTSKGAVYMYHYGNHKAQWHWLVGVGEDVKLLLEGMLPHLGERRTVRALAALERIEQIPKLGYKRPGKPIITESEWNELSAG